MTTPPSASSPNRRPIPSDQPCPVWKPFEAGVIEQIVLTAVRDETDTGQPSWRWIAEDTRRPGCWTGADDFIEAVRLLADARETWDAAFGGESS